MGHGTPLSVKSWPDHCHSRKPNFVFFTSMTLSPTVSFVVTTYCFGSSGHHSFGFSHFSDSLTVSSLPGATVSSFAANVFSAGPPSSGATSSAIFTAIGAPVGFATLISRPSVLFFTDGRANTSDV